MISAISPINNNIYRKQVSFNKNSAGYHPKDLLNDPNLSDIEKERLKLEYSNHDIRIGEFIFLALTFLTVLTSKKTGVFNHFKGKFNKEFESLSDNKNIPLIDECKSINQTLREILQTKVNAAKLDAATANSLGGVEDINRILLYGSPGVGKSFFAKVYAKSIGADYLEILDSEITSKWAGEGVVNLKKVFDYILETSKKNPNKKYVVTLNEFDTYLSAAGKLGRSEGTHSVSLLKERSALITHLDILKEEAPNVTIIGTTNISPTNKGIDGAILSRFGSNIYKVPYPDEGSLFEAIIAKILKMTNGETIIKDNEIAIKEIAKKMQERTFSFRNMDYVVEESKRLYISDKLKEPATEYHINYITKAIEKLKLSDGEIEAAKNL